MCIARRSGLVLAFGLAVLVLGAPAARAHPVAQGALDVAVSGQVVEVTARVSLEEVLVAAAYGGGGGRPLPAMLREHGDYLLRHIRLTADDRRLEGTVAAVPEHPAGPPMYRLQYRLAGAGTERLALQEDVLREFEFAPGNPWEASYVVRVRRDGQTLADGLLLTSREPLRLALASLVARASPVDVPRLMKDYVRHGVVHILSGYDHLLFIAALALAVVTLWDLVRVISAFTLAHSITLTLSVLNVVRLPSGVVEPMIAASIVFVALQNVFVPERSRGAGRLLVAFFFGLFHGLGFAGGLLAAMEGMAGLAVGLAILAFSLGVEIGHQMVVLPIFGVVRVMGGRAPDAGGMPAGMLRYGSAGILVAGVFYLIEALR